MRARLVVGAGGIVVHPGDEAIGHVGVVVIARIRIPLHGIAEVVHGRERHRDS